MCVKDSLTKIIYDVVLNLNNIDSILEFKMYLYYFDFTIEEGLHYQILIWSAILYISRISYDYNQSIMFISSSRVQQWSFRMLQNFVEKIKTWPGQRWRVASLVSLNMQQLFPYLRWHVVLSRRFVTLRNGPYLVSLTRRVRRESGEFSARKLVRRGSAILQPYTSLNMQELFPYISRHVAHEMVRVK